MPRRETIVTALALLVLAAAIPFAIVESMKKGRVYRNAPGKEARGIA
jgi:hypothetical protein